MLIGVLGAGGCGRGILPLLRPAIGPADRLCFIDEAFIGQTINGVPCLSFAEFAGSGEDKEVCLAVANGAVRRRLDAQCREAGIRFRTVRADTTIVMDDVEIGEGALVSPYTSFTSNIRVGRHFHCNLYSYVEHDCVIGDFVTFAPAVRCNGDVRIGDGAYIGSGAVIRQGIRIGAEAVVGMGAVVVKDVPDGITVVGNPARPLQRA
jgi:sugar O-acyltransferase (sialic acid O-acetyltransferase NeuD family)